MPSARSGFRSKRRWAGAATLSIAAGLLACSDDDSGPNPTPAIADSDAGAASGVTPRDGDVPAGVLVPPDTAAGRQLAWLLELLNERGGIVDEAELGEHFSDSFLQAVPVPQLQQTFVEIASDAPFALLQLPPDGTETSLSALVDAGGTPVVIFISLEAATGTIAGLLFQAVPELEGDRPTTWQAVDTSVAALATRTNYLVARVAGGRCESLHGASSDTRLALGSTFKLYVLAELARQIEAGTLGWNDPVVVQDALEACPPASCKTCPKVPRCPWSTWPPA
jgi:ORF 12 gene product N-terminal